MLASTTTTVYPFARSLLLDFGTNPNILLGSPLRVMLLEKVTNTVFCPLIWVMLVLKVRALLQFVPQNIQFLDKTGL